MHTRTLGAFPWDADSKEKGGGGLKNQTRGGRTVASEMQQTRNFAGHLGGTTPVENQKSQNKKEKAFVTRRLKETYRDQQGRERNSLSNVRWRWKIANWQRHRDVRCTKYDG